MERSVEFSRVFENNGNDIKSIEGNERIITDFINLLDICLTQEPENEDLISLWKNVDRFRARFDLPYIFPGGLGAAQTVDGVSGLLSIGDLEALNYCCNKVRGKCVNIGVFEGLSAYFIAKSNREIEVYGVDAYLGMSGNEKDFNYERFDKANKNLKFIENAQLIIGLSVDVAKDWKKEIDFLFIDGDHSVEGALSDFKYWTPFLKIDGFIAIHDAYSKINNSYYKFRKKLKFHGPDCICQLMEEDPNYEFVMVKGCTEVWQRKS